MQERAAAGERGLAWMRKRSAFAAWCKIRGLLVLKASKMMRGDAAALVSSVYISSLSVDAWPHSTASAWVSASPDRRTDYSPQRLSRKNNWKTVNVGRYRVCSVYQWHRLSSMGNLCTLAVYVLKRSDIYRCLPFLILKHFHRHKFAMLGFFTRQNKACRWLLDFLYRFLWTERP